MYIHVRFFGNHTGRFDGCQTEYLIHLELKPVFFLRDQFNIFF
jgi:hypothetical protein